MPCSGGAEFADPDSVSQSCQQISQIHCAHRLLWIAQQASGEPQPLQVHRVLAVTQPVGTHRMGDTVSQDVMVQPPQKKRKNRTKKEKKY